MGDRERVAENSSCVEEEEEKSIALNSVRSKAKIKIKRTPNSLKPKLFIYMAGFGSLCYDMKSKRNVGMAGFFFSFFLTRSSL